MEHVEHIAWDGKPLAYIIRAKVSPEKTTFLIPPQFEQQVGFVVYPAVECSSFRCSPERT